MESNLLEILTIVGTFVTIIARVVYIRTQIKVEKRQNKKQPPTLR